MFQNIAEEEKIEEAVERDIIAEKLDVKEIVRKLCTKQNILVYILSFMLGCVSTINGMAPFGVAIFAAALSNGLPAGVVFVFALIGTLISLGAPAALTFILTALIFTAMVLIFKPWYEEEYKSERRKLGKYVFFSVAIVQLLQILFNGFLLYDLFLGITLAVVTYIFYKIFANSLIVISEYGFTKAFTVEEIVGASLMLAVSITALGNLQVFGFQVKTVLCILIVLILGWKKGILIGGTSGITIGAVLGVISGSEQILIASFAISRNDSRFFKQIWKDRSNIRFYCRKRITFICFKWKYSRDNISKGNCNCIFGLTFSSKEYTNKCCRLFFSRFVFTSWSKLWT